MKKPLPAKSPAKSPTKLPAKLPEKGPTQLYWDAVQQAEFTFYLAATNDGLCCLTLPNESFETVETWRDKRMPRSLLVRNPAKLTPYTEQLRAYFQGELRNFSFPLDLKGTPFQVAVWHALRDVPFGTTLTYSEIAEVIGRPRAVRAVGAANALNPIPIIVPCHRIVGKNTTLTGYRGGLAMKRYLLELEGITRYS